MNILITLNDQGGGVMDWNYTELAGTLRAQMGGHPPIVVISKDEKSAGLNMNYTMQAFGLYKKSEIASAVKARDYKDATDLIIEDGDGMGSIVRRLTPLECERLQGFPDNWTNIGTWTDSKGRKRESTDSMRYKALGNSIALPGWFYILRRISAQYERPATMGSLFDGIGGFPLCWERCNGKGTAIWASEIEEFPIAVTKFHFPEDDE